VAIPMFRSVWLQNWGEHHIEMLTPTEVIKMPWKKTEGFVDEEGKIPFVEWKKGRDVIVVQKGNGGFWYIFRIKLRSAKSKYIDSVRTLAHFKTKEEAVEYVKNHILGGGAT